MASVTGTGTPPPINWGKFGLDDKQMQELATKFAAGQFAPLAMSDAAEIAAQLGMTPPLDMNIGDIFALVAALKTKVEETSLDITQGDVKNAKEEQKTKSAERMEKLQEQVDQPFPLERIRLASVELENIHVVSPQLPQAGFEVAAYHVCLPDVVNLQLIAVLSVNAAALRRQVVLLAP